MTDKSLEELMQEMTKDLWSALKNIEDGRDIHDFRSGSSNRFWNLYIELEAMGLAHWREYGNVGQFEDYWISDKGKKLLELYRKQQDSEQE